MLAGQSGIEAPLHQLLARAGDGVDAGIQCLGDLAVAPGFAGLRGVGEEFSAGLASLDRTAGDTIPMRQSLFPKRPEDKTVRIFDPFFC